MKKRDKKNSSIDSMLNGSGESYSTILRYSLPELITALLLYSLPFWLDSWFVAQLASTSRYATLGATNNLLHWLTKIAEAISVGTVVVAGQFNGRQEYQKVGRVLADSFWVTVILGGIISLALFFGASMIYEWYGVPQKMIALGVPFLRLRALGIFFMFIFLAFIGFLRGIKNTRTPMNIFIIGSIVFVIFDYLFIFGKAGFPQLGLQGSAIASVIQYGVMLLVAVVIILSNKTYRIYAINLLDIAKDTSHIKDLLNVSWPVLIDKSVMALSYIWLCKMIASMGKVGIATFAVVKDMERFALLPAIALAQVVTLLVSNDFGKKNWHGIRNNVRKIVIIASVAVFSTLILFSLNPRPIVHLFDQKNIFSELAIFVFPILSILVFFDLLQLILAGALRGSGDVRAVMITRIIVSICFFVPMSYVLSQLYIESNAAKFILIYGSFYIGNALMCVAYIRRFGSSAWQKSPL
jgi:MATE family multidrug resistance protein